MPLFIGLTLKEVKLAAIVLWQRAWDYVYKHSVVLARIETIYS